MSQNRRRDKEFHRQTEVKGIHHHYTSPTKMLKGTVTGKERLTISRSSKKNRKHKSSKNKCTYKNQPRD